MVGVESLSFLVKRGVLGCQRNPLYMLVTCDVITERPDPTWQPAEVWTVLAKVA